jgi:hypothetical protein
VKKKLKKELKSKVMLEPKWMCQADYDNWLHEITISETPTTVTIHKQAAKLLIEYFEQYCRMEKLFNSFK